MKEYDIMMIGHISKDIMIDYKGNEERILGGPVVQSSAAAVGAGASVLVLTKGAARDAESIEKLKSNGADWSVIESPDTTSVKNVYHTENQERRDVLLISRADPFTLEEIPENPTRIFHLAGIVKGEIPDNLMEPLSERGKVAIDVAGSLRNHEAGQLVNRDWKDKHTYLPMVSYFKMDAAEGEILTGETDRLKAAQKIVEWGAEEVMLTFNTEVIVCRGDEVYKAPYTNRSFVGRTGRGDSTFAAYLAWRLNHSIEESLTFAVALCSIKMETPGPFKGTVAQVEERIKKDYK